MRYKNTILNLLLIIADLWLSTGDDYYGLLGVSRTADQKEIRRAFKQLALTEHPDKNNDNPEAHAKFVQLSRAYEILKDPVLRQKYDNYGEEGIDISNKRQTYHSWSYNANNFGIYDDDDPWIITLDETDYFESVLYKKKVWLINFYSPACGSCHRFAPIWKKIAEELDEALKMGVVNCEDEWQLCRRIGIKSYPMLMHYPKNSKYGEQYKGEMSYASVMNFIVNHFEVDIREIEEPLKDFISRGSRESDRPMLIFICGAQRDCFASTERLKIAATFENVIDVKITYCNKKEDCDEIVSLDTKAVYLSATPYKNNTWHVVPFEDIDETKELIKKVMERLPEPCDLDANEFQKIKKRLMEEKTFNPGWLIHFYIGHGTNSDPVLKKLLSVSDAVKLGKINCGKYSSICTMLSINRYPMWGILKTGGAFELYHGKNSFNDIVKFVYSSIKATNVWALSGEQVMSIMERNNGNEAWFLDWYAPWCPPCMQFIKEVRKASVEFHKSIIRFGTIDCTVYSDICRRYNIRSYPTAILINGTNTNKFSLQKTAVNIVRFINEARHRTVVRLTLKNYEKQLGQRKGKFIWVVDYFAPWCAPCQRLTPEWITVANTLSVLPFVKVASVDCEAESTLCSTQRIHSYPTIRIYSKDSKDLTVFDSYNGHRDSVSILRWITNFFPRKVRPLDPTTLQEGVLNDRSTWVVNFFIPWCEQCQQLESQFAIVAQLLERSTIQFGRFNCEVYAAECGKAGITSYPTLVAYDSRYNRKRIADGFRINEIVAEKIKDNLLNFIARLSHDEL
ncbi:PREDICTED: dnaJ homolog subfamily C member 10-like [Dufourea novaeangliae]|uniref:dnaJ homolog subfamily C member 10-like n=1 Tax=Dufourea novaeangliae TaxID=178035 RepID=UPI0007675961|nr:PREDICTED: dnaJ homolog subfamily C member 10-like [Dufourea novaeangliae]